MTPPAPPAPRPDRDYLFAGLAALLVVFVGVTMRGGPVPGAAAVAPGLLGLLVGWTSMPVVFLLLLSYLLVFPYGLPYYPAAVNDAVGSHLRVPDLVMAAAALIYLTAQYHLFGLTDRLMPADPAAGPPAGGRRPPGAVVPGEFGRILAAAAASLAAGQAAWFALTHVALDLDAFPPVRPGPPPMMPEAFGAAAWFTRVVVLGGVVAAGGALAGFGFWYWRLLRLTPVEARMVLFDAGWRESRRELNRIEKWRAWGRARAARKGGGS
jgi:hypothetical protein